VTVKVQEEDFDLSHEVARLRDGKPQAGAVACLVGLVRDVNDGEPVTAMTLEHYPGMTEKALQGIVAEAKGRWDLVDVTVIHRVGNLRPLDQIVLVAVASAHRGEAFAACEFIMDYLKTRAPFWKKEKSGEAERWVDARESDDSSASRWRKS
jgi:molybdopterin synthase catalytic subunit